MHNNNVGSLPCTQQKLSWCNISLVYRRSTTFKTYNSLHIQIDKIPFNHIKFLSCRGLYPYTHIINHHLNYKFTHTKVYSSEQNKKSNLRQRSRIVCRIIIYLVHLCLLKQLHLFFYYTRSNLHLQIFFHSTTYIFFAKQTKYIIAGSIFILKFFPRNFLNVGQFIFTMV